MKKELEALAVAQEELLNLQTVQVHKQNLLDKTPEAAALDVATIEYQAALEEFNDLKKAFEGKALEHAEVEGKKIFDGFKVVSRKTFDVPDKQKVVEWLASNQDYWGALNYKLADLKKLAGTLNPDCVVISSKQQVQISKDLAAFLPEVNDAD